MKLPCGDFFVLSLVIGCAQKPRTQPQASELKDSGLSQPQIEGVKKFEKDYAVVLQFHDHVIQVFPLGSELPTHTEAWTQEMNALHEAIGDDFTNYTVKLLAMEIDDANTGWSQRRVRRRDKDWPLEHERTDGDRARQASAY